jgi:hypothetical protein
VKTIVLHENSDSARKSSSAVASPASKIASLRGPKDVFNHRKSDQRRGFSVVVPMPLHIAGFDRNQTASNRIRYTRNSVSLSISSNREVVTGQPLALRVGRLIADAGATL